jgi:hypothetical protein
MLPVITPHQQCARDEQIFDGAFRNSEGKINEFIVFNLQESIYNADKLSPLTETRSG